MNNNDLIAKVAEATGKTKTDTKTFLDATIGALTAELSAGNEISLNNFGKLVVNDRPEREGRNPATGETITIAASKSVKFKPAKALKDAL